MNDVSERRLEQLFADWATQERNDDRGLFEDFARAFLARSGERIFQTHDADSLRRVVESAFALSSRRAAGERRVRVTHPVDLPGRAVIEILQDDRPFLVDTLRLLLRRHRLREQCLLHPTLSVERNAAGDLERVVSTDPRVQVERRRESLIHVEVFPRLDAQATRAFEEDLAKVMDWVRNVTDDHASMIRAVREVADNVAHAGQTLDVAAGRSEKICRFLDWLVDGHFVLLGIRRYDVSAQDGSWQVRIRANEGLGIWHERHESRFAETVRGEELPPGLRAALDDPRIIQISKGFVESRIHRAGRMDRVLVKEHDDQGRVSGFQIISGLFTFAALRTPCSQLPLLAERLEQILADDGASPGSHRHKAIVAAFDSAPMEFLLDANVSENATLIAEIVEAEGAEDLRVVLRSDSRGRSFYVAVIMQRERYGEALRSDIRRLFERDESVGFVDDRVSFLEEGSAMLHFFCTMKSGEVPDVTRLEREIQRLAANWDDRLTDELIHERGPAEGGELAARYVDAFPEGLHATTHPADAVRDIQGLEALFSSGEPQIALRIDGSHPDASDQLLRIYLRDEMLLSDLLPIIDHIGIRVVDARQIRVSALDRPVVYLHALRIEPLGANQQDLDAVEERLADALRAVFGRVMPSDPLNALVLSAGLDWREVDLVRSYVEYYNQIQAGLTRRFVSDVLLQNPAAARLLVRYHFARLGPGFDDADRREREKSLSEEFAAYRDRIDNLNEDRALGAVFELIDATLRTNFFANPGGPHRIATKLDPSRVSDVQRPHAYREIFVHAPGMNGIHIRGGPIARGGLRWSDRLDDFRTEVLGLMRTQQLKNGLIVPVGAKGGFVLRTMGLTGRAARIEADAKYGDFIESLLDVTDNIGPDGSVVHPDAVHCRDDDDPYLVVAADKGTAHLSDTANSIARSRGFWLGDAFASGGSVGYDHKKYAITARGAWECVRHHFAEMGIDPERDAFSVAGIGDMSGDVFGNGLLLMKKARLVAAFDHRHIFLDPDPDPARAWTERRRLFELAGSSWSDYSRECLSPGGGVHPRSAKKIEISPEVRACLGIQDATLTGPGLIRAILAAPVDLLWNGGIGTYVKATHETHADVGDRTNESVRIDARALRARVIGEGGNLGLSQAARVEAALAGIRLDTDAIHNSAGVDLSDHEVNYKILLAPAVLEESLGEAERAACLFDVAEAACESVLVHNRSQSLAISLDERRSRLDPERFGVASEFLCESQGVSAGALGLPDDATLRVRKSQGEGLVRPELSVLLGLAKLDLRLALSKDDFVDEEEMAALHSAYYPSALRERFGSAVDRHRLRREIVALEAANEIVDVGGVTAITSLVAKRGISIPAAAAAWQAADAILDAGSLRAVLLAFRGEISFEAVYDALIDLDAAVQDVARYLISENLGLQGRTRTESWRSGLFGLGASVDQFLSSEETSGLREREARFAASGFPAQLATILAMVSLADRGLNIVRLAEETDRSAADLAPAYAKLGERSRINWVFRNLPLAKTEDVWDRIVLMDLRTEILLLQRELTREAVARRPEEPFLAVDEFLLDHALVLSRVRALINETTSTPTTSSLSVVTQTLLRLRSVAR